MAVFNGTNVALSVGGTVIGQATECSLTLNQETIDVTTKDSSGNRELIGGMKSGSMSVSGLIDVSAATTGALTLVAQWETGGSVAVVFDHAATGGKTFTGSGIITSLEQSGGTEDAPTFSASIELTGAITVAAT
jgi:TP901-1 family phage major tail protein